MRWRRSGPSACSCRPCSASSPAAARGTHDGGEAFSDHGNQGGSIAMTTALKKIPDGAGAREVYGVTSNPRAVEGAATGAVAPVAASKAAPAARATPRSPASLRVTRIAAASPWHETGLGELARAWELLLVFTWRQIGV